MDAELFSRQELLSGELNRKRRATRLLAAIEERCIYLREESRQVVEAYFLEGDGDFQRRFCRDYIESLDLAANAGGEGLRLEHLEQFSAQWAPLAPGDPELRARLIRQVHAKYAANAANAPRTLACLGAGDPAVRASYQALFGEFPDEGIQEDGSLPPDLPLLAQIEARLEWLNLAAGEVLFRAGDPGDAVYVVISGRMQAIRLDESGRQQILVEIGRGEMLGEMALLTGEPRSATVRAARDSELVRLARQDLFALARQDLQVLLRVSALIIRRLNQQISGAKPRLQDRSLSFALLPCDAGVPLEEFGRQLVESLAAFGPATCLTRGQLEEAIEPGAAQAGTSDPRNAQIVSWLTEIEACHRYVVYQAEAQPSEWSLRCIRQADRVVLVGSYEADPQPCPHETALLARWKQLHSDVQGGLERDANGVQLVLLHASNASVANAGIASASGGSASTNGGIVNTDGGIVNTDQSGRTARWLAARSPGAHHHVRMGSQADMDSLARRLSNRDLGLVLSGGGARGFGHIGVLRALRELKIPIDAVGGTSMGALMGAAFASGMDDRELSELARRIGSRQYLLDRSLPLISFYATRKITDLICELSRGLDLEDLWLPFFCVSCNLSRGSLMVHTRGPAWLGVRASMAAMPIFTPILHAGDLLVDGGFLNNLPVDVMRQQFGCAAVLGVDCSSLSPKTGAYDFGPSISAWEALRYQMQPPERRTGPPNMLAGLTQIMDTNGIYRQQFTKDQADLIVRLPTRGWGMLDFDCSAEIIAAAYQTACEQLAGWRPDCLQE